MPTLSLLLVLATSPAPQPIAGEPLGEAPWSVIAAVPGTRELFVGTPASVMRMAWPSQRPRWTAPLGGSPLFLAPTADGQRLAVLVRSGWDNLLELVLLAADSGAVVGRRRVEVPAPPSQRASGMQPPTQPTGLFAQPGGAPGFWLTNAYGTWSLRADDTAPLAKVEPAWDVVTQDGGSALRIEQGGVVSSGGHKTSLDCYPQRFVADARLDRLASICAERQGTSVRLYALSSGKRLGEWPVAGYPQLVIVGGAELVLLDSPGRRGKVDNGALFWTAQGGSFSGFDVSPSSRTVLGFGGGVVEVVDAGTRRSRCRFADTAPVGAGLEDDRTGWLLGYQPGVQNQLLIERLDLEKCKSKTAARLELGKTTHYDAVWLRGMRAFALDALLEGGHGPVVVQVDGTVHRLRDRGTPALVASEDGTRLALVESEWASVYLAGVPPRAGKEVGKAATAALCGERTLVYSWNEGWRAYAADGAPPASAPFAPQPQPDVVSCAGSTLLVGRTDSWTVLDLRTGKPVSVWQTTARVGPAKVFPDGRRVIFAGGPTGWLLATLTLP